MSCHLVLGDFAAEVLRELLGPYADIRIHRDDLAVGPLIDIDHVYPAARIKFWNQVFPLSSFDFSDVLPAGNAQLAALPEELTLWIGTSCGEALLLRRLAWWRNQAGESFKLMIPDTTAVKSYVAGQVPLSLLSTAQIESASSKLVSPARLQTLAQEWQALCQPTSMFRGWNGQTFRHLDETALDAEMLDLLTDNYLPCSQIAGFWIQASKDFFRSDVLAMWRLRCLAAKGLIEMESHPDQYNLFAFKVRKNFI
ncbi:DUF3658 domain-containing protein [Iodobacter ciconiae]|uniref:DUF1835 domain-containing protein n=1 Tax=Iodobacter ciconiae TaxID=2496266 RepID=A0A3S8ZUA2_9NEIS|nr:DUF3658 domain-containing protein [Iodobacter ciconiae]AZN37058.1 DUF1835 domain-containing protein [Iodobacter ciconiae]